MAQLMYPGTTKAIKSAENLSFFWGGLAAISAACALAGRLGYEPHASVPVRAYLLAIGGFGLFCIQDKRIANKYRRQLIGAALQISDEQAFYAQDFGIEAYIAHRL